MHQKAVIHLPSETEAEEIGRELLEEGLVAGTFVNPGFSQYHWKDEIEEARYWRLEAFCPAERKDDIIELVESQSSEEVPAIAFSDIDGNQDFLDWIEENTR